MAGNHDRMDNDCSMSTTSDRCRHAKTKEPKKNITARDSNGGISRVRTASDGHVAHNGIAKAPTQVHVFGERVRCLIGGGLSTPNHNVVLDMFLDTLIVEVPTYHALKLGSLAVAHLIL